ncbi:hypothetical protein [Luteimonas salinisoli]|uniref:hypothetical protein n=1 Tax=Luteimonas salinisoli TaxID=2752307 RepID=UPI001C5CA398|nr:hypothetical protein [Luteimonas salinisoli]
MLLLSAGVACKSKDIDPASGVSVHEAWYAAAEKAEARSDRLKRCTSAPNPPGLEWSRSIVRALCGDNRTLVIEAEELRDRIERADWSGLHSLYAGYLRRHHSGADPERLLYRAFRTAGWSGPEELDEYSRRWSEAAPDDPYASTLRAKVLMEQAWAIRGERPAREIPRERLDAVRRLAGESSALAERAILAEPGLLPAHMELLRALALSGGRGRSAEVLAKAVDVSPSNYYVRQTAIHFLSPNWGGSMERIDAVIRDAQAYGERNPRLALLKVERDSYEGAQLSHRRQFGPALDAYRRALAGGPEYSTIESAAWVADMAGRHAEAAMLGSQLLRFAGNTAERLASRAYSWEKMDEWQRALRDYAGAAQRDPGNAAHPYRMASIHHRRQNFDLAEQQYLRTLELDPEHTEALRGVCRMWVHLTLEPGMAEPYAARLTRLLPEDPDAWLLLANVQHSLKRPEVHATARRFLELAPADDPEFRDPIANIMRFLGEE